MSEAERRKGYRFDRVLCETSRILTPEFDDTVVYLTGAQVEMLRNITQYLRRAETYVSEYAPGYYLTPTVGDLDDILAIVADLEEELMGNPNTLWGYKDRIAEQRYDLNPTGGSGFLDVGPVPAGEVWEINIVNAYNAIGDSSVVATFVMQGAWAMPLGKTLNPIAYQETLWHGALVMKQGDVIYATWNGIDDGDDIYLFVWGSKMVVPT